MKRYAGEYFEGFFEETAIDILKKIENREKIDIEEMKRKAIELIKLAKDYNSDIEEWFELNEYKKQKKIFDEMVENQEKIVKMFKNKDYFSQRLNELEESN